MKIHLRLVLAAAMAVGATGAIAMFAAMSPDDLYDKSALVVTGAIDGVASAGDHREGTLSVDRTLKGTPGADVRVWMYPEGGPLSSSDIEVPVGEAGLWFLEAVPGNEGLYRIGHPQRFVPAAQAQPVIDQIDRQ